MVEARDCGRFLDLTAARAGGFSGNKQDEELEEAGCGHACSGAIDIAFPERELFLEKQGAASGRRHTLLHGVRCAVLCNSCCCACKFE